MFTDDWAGSQFMFEPKTFAPWRLDEFLICHEIHFVVGREKLTMKSKRASWKGGTVKVLRDEKAAVLAVTHQQCKSPPLHILPSLLSLPAAGRCLLTATRTWNKAGHEAWLASPPASKIKTTSFETWGFDCAFLGLCKEDIILLSSCLHDWRTESDLMVVSKISF